jgi:hypothetical protein
MEAGNFDLHANFGVNYSVNFEYVDEQDAPINLGTGNLSFYVKKSVLPYDTFFEIHSDGSIVEGVLPFPETQSAYGTINVANGIATLEVTAETMEQLQPTTYFYTLIRRVNNTETMILKGKFVVEAA